MRVEDLFVLLTDAEKQELLAEMDKVIAERGNDDRFE